MVMVALFEYPLYFFMILFPLIPSTFKLKGISIGDILLIVIVMLYSLRLIFTTTDRVKYILRLKSILKNKLFVSIFLWVLFMFLSIVYSIDKKAALNESIRFLCYALFFTEIAANFNRNDMIERLTRIFIISSVLIGIIGLYQYISGKGIIQATGTISLLRVSSTLENPNNLGAFYILVFFPIASLAISEKKVLMKIILSVCSIIALLNIFFSFSRNSLIVLILGCVLFILTYNLKYSIPFFVLGGIAFFIPGVAARMSQIGSSAQNASRIKIWDIAIIIIKQHPILGIGSGNYSKWYLKYSAQFENISTYAYSDKLHPHNAFLKAQCELGIFGLIAFICFIIFSLISIKKVAKYSKNKIIQVFYRGFFVSSICFVLMNIIDNFFSAPKVVIFYVIMVAAGHAVLLNDDGNLQLN